ncbi:Alkane hydroxylase mah1 [Heracleum sosnowskyi]|uniref:Alkane hydroxylase mah1 n=1 Tax=Heracleum sosnowskyi TaxID=360622 RepID=A0AAD8NAJ0_9APIA|nr:Alkane hydroxylase mah1 [Heracleum sosnowskyi]
MPGLLKNAHRLLDFTTCLLQESHHTFYIHGPFLANRNFLLTCDPANVNYILSKNFTNYSKGPEFGKIFDILGEGIFNSDGHLWEVHRRTTMSLFNSAQFCRMLQKTVREKVEKGLLPVLDHVSKHGIEVDLQDIFQRLTFDNISSLLLDHDPQSLTLDLPDIPFQKAIPAVEEALFYRNILPEIIWKMQNWIGFGKERRLKKAWETIDEYIFTCISMKRQQVARTNSHHMSSADEDDKLDWSAAYMELAYKENMGSPNKFLRDTLLSLLIGGRNTTSAALSWFFWLLWKNPLVESKILEEIRTNLQTNELKSWMLFNKKEDLCKLVYLHGALCEVLRLYPPVPLNNKAPTQADILPSGHQVEKDSKIVLSFYSMGRMESIWGKDCLEFKPERWITEKGEIKHEPSYKFTAFNAGPRSCLGKEMSFTQMKIVATTIISTYRVQLIESHPIVPRDSIGLKMKYGLKRVKRAQSLKRGCNLIHSMLNCLIWEFGLFELRGREWQRHG